MPDNAAVFARLRAILEPYAARPESTVDRADELSLTTTYVLPNGSPLWFGGVQVRRRYVSYHLMPVYVNPALLDGVSPGLRRRRPPSVRSSPSRTGTLRSPGRVSPHTRSPPVWSTRST